MSRHIPRPGADVLELVRACGRHLRNADLRAVQQALHTPNAQSPSEATLAQLEAVYDTACRLCDQGNFRFAAALALHLVSYQPTDPRFSFVAGTCMQRLGVHVNAAQFFCHALMTGGDDAATFYRLAECLIALGDKANAEKALDAAIDLSRNIEYASTLQAMAQDLLENIRRKSA
jgi:predicted Zn-dependent protease